MNLSAERPDDGDKPDETEGQDSIAGGPNVYGFVVSEAAAGQRLDAFLATQIAETSRVRVRRGIDLGMAQVDGMTQKPSYRLEAGQHVEFILPEPPATGPQPEAIPINILFEDDQIAVVDKPPGMVVHPAKGHWSGTLASALVHYFSELSQVGGIARPGIVHRLDRDTSGVMVIAKTDQAHMNLTEQFQNRTVQKEYVAIVLGSPDRDRDLIDHPVGPHPSKREKMALRSDGAASREAQTFYEVEERFRGFALLRAFPKTGRTHQIRLHLTAIRCPVLCDKLYGGRAELTLAELRNMTRCQELAADRRPDHVVLDRQALHAEVLRFKHPSSKQDLEFRAELPADLQLVLLLLRQSKESA